MKTIVLCVVLVLFCLSVVLCVVKPAQALRSLVFEALDKDVLYLADGRIVRGWIWQQTESSVAGSTSEEDFFSYDRSEVKRVQENALLEVLRSLR